MRYRLDKTRPVVPLEKPAISSPTSHGIIVIIARYVGIKKPVSLFHFRKTSSDEESTTIDAKRNDGAIKRIIFNKLNLSQQLSALYPQ